MDWEQRCIRLCAAVLICAVLLRLWTDGAFVPVGQALESERTASFLLYLQTGRVVRSLPEPSVRDRVPVQVLPAEQSVPDFSGEDLDRITVNDTCGASPDLQALLTDRQVPELTGEGPRVLILHSHTTESFTQTELDRYEESSPYRTLDPGHNMIELGQIVAEILRDSGIEVIHDTELHDYPSYNGSYSHAAASTRELLEQYPTIELILDLHRDAADTPTGQMATRCTVGGESAAQLMFVMGTDTRLKHPDWERNLSLALKLQALLERENPGLCRDLKLSQNRYNQHLGEYALLIEIGAAGNTLDQARLAARELGEAIVQRSKMEHTE